MHLPAGSNPCLGLTGLPESHSDHLPAWRGIVELLLKKDDDWRKTINKSSGFPTKKDSLQPEFAAQRKTEWAELRDWAQEQSGLLDTLRDIRALPPAHYADDQWQVLEALTNLLPRLVAELKLVFQQQRASDFAEITLNALQALGSDEEPTDLTLRLDAQINHILIDEFQDTSSVQFRLLRLLTSGWQNGDGRSLFIVGDGMQSLYSFRNANVGLFLDARKHPIGNLQLEPLDLSVNFRSQANIIHWVNAVFAEAFPPVMDSGRGAVPYGRSDGFKPALSEPAVTIDVLSNEDEAHAILEAELVAQRALQTRQQNPAASIAILVRGRAHLREILPALRAHQLPWQAQDIDPLAAAMPVIDLVSLTRALLNPADRIAWLAILRAPWCGLDLADLLAIATAPINANPTPEKAQYPLLLLQLLNHGEIGADQGPKLSAEGKKIIPRVATVIANAWQQRYRKPLRTWVEGTWLALGGPTALGTGEDASIALHQCQQYFDLLESHSKGAVSIDDWPSFQYAIDQLYAEPLAEKEPLADKKPLADDAPTSSADKPAPLQIMTIHKSKGLEFDTVIIPGLDRRGANNSHELLLWRERVNNDGSNQLLLSPPQKLGAGDDALYTHLKREENIKSRLENTRVLYVACTRAIQRLHLLFRQPTKNPAAGSLLASAWPVLEKHIIVDEDGELPPALEHCAITRHSPSVAISDEHPEEERNEPTNEHSYSFRLPPEWRSPFADNEPRGNPNNKPVMAGNKPPAISLPGASDPRKIGTLLHRTLRLLVLEGIDQWTPERMSHQQKSWAIQVQQAGIIDAKGAINVLNEAVTMCLADHPQHWIFDRSHAHSYCEFALNYRDPKGNISSAIIDRCFVIDNTQWIVDYKTAMPAEGQALDDFLRQQRQSYQEQLALYAQTLSQLHNNLGENSLKIKAALYFPLLSHLEIVLEH